MRVQRVHRTGQTRPVVVKTMAIHDTVEQAMLERREAIVMKTTKMPALTEEAGMRSYIEVTYPLCPVCRVLTAVEPEFLVGNRE
jgi:hypothetical protein